MKTPREYWKERFDEYPQTDAEKLAVAFATEYVENVIKAKTELQTCPKCGSDDIDVRMSLGVIRRQCRKCWHLWRVDNV